MEIKEIFKLFDKFSQSAVDELELEVDTFRLKLKKHRDILPIHQEVSTQKTGLVQEVSQSIADDVPGSEAVPAPTVAPEEQDVKIVTSPIVGSFYRAPAPDAPPFVVEGDAVQQGKSLAVIEAMKVMNHLEADYDMEIVSILVQNGDMVEFGTPLFEVRAT